MNEGLEAIHRREWAIVVASLARSFGDLDLAEDAAAEAFASAVERWPHDGVPPNPGAWLMAVARNKTLIVAPSMSFARRARLRRTGMPSSPAPSTRIFRDFTFEAV